MQEDFRGRNSTEGKRRRALLRVLLASLFLTSGALAQNPKISGVVFFYPSKVKMANVKLTFSGVGDTYTNDVGFYQMEVPSSWSGTLTPSCAGYDFEDSTRTFTNVSSDIQFQDF